MDYEQLLERRRALRNPKFKTLADVGFDWDVVTPLQRLSRAPHGPVLLFNNWFDAESAVRLRDQLHRGYMPGIPTNRVIDLALSAVGLSREDVYMTQAFHLLPVDQRSGARITFAEIDDSFESVTIHELRGRPVIALGDKAQAACGRHHIDFIPVLHPSARGEGLSDAHKAELLAAALHRAQ